VGLVVRCVQLEQHLEKLGVLLVTHVEHPRPSVHADRELLGGYVGGTHIWAAGDVAYTHQVLRGPEAERSPVEHPVDKSA
jgi:hypothetical protein